MTEFRRENCTTVNAIPQFHIGQPRASNASMLDPISSRIEQYMDLLSTRQKLVASNIANIDTPNYKAKDIDFQFEYLSYVQGSAPSVQEVQGLDVKNDGNNVSLDRETRLLSENAIRFNLAANLIHSQFQLVQTAIQEGSK